MEDYLKYPISSHIKNRQNQKMMIHKIKDDSQDKWLFTR